MGAGFLVGVTRILLMNRPKASFIKRSLALILDIILLEFLGAFVTFPIQKIMHIAPNEILQDLLQGSGDLRQIFLFLMIYSLILLLLWGAYFAIFWGYTGQTPGKKIIGIKVVMEDGSPLTPKTAFNRFVGYSVSASAFFLGFLWALFDAKGQTWHDKMANTIVIKF